MRILSVRKGRTVPVLLFAVSEGQEEPQKYGISEEEYRALGSPAAGTPLTEEEAEALLSYDERHRARSAALRLLEFSDNNPRQLIRKLMARGFSRETAERATAEMVERGYIREGDQLRRAVLAAARKLWGPRRIAAALASRGFDKQEVEKEVEALITEGELDFSASRRRLLEKEGKDKDPQKLRAMLYRYGYGGEE